MNSVFYAKTTIGTIGVVENGVAITQIFFGKQIVKEAEEKETVLIAKAMKQIKEYLAKERQKFDLPIELVGTSFQKSVWKELLTIPYGKTNSYKEVAIKIGNPKACRAIGMANHNNPIAIVVPCHRVIGVDGSLTGYAGGLAIKKQLLALEKALL